MTVEQLDPRRRPPIAKAVPSLVPLKSQQDLEPPCTVDMPPLLPDGDYEVSFVRAEEAYIWGNRHKVFLQFRIVQPGDYLGQVLFMAVTFPTNGRFSLSSKYLQQWTLAAGRQPSRHDRLSTKVFRNKVFLGHVRTVTKDHL
jgi:hypothetical protein